MKISRIIPTKILPTKGWRKVLGFALLSFVIGLPGEAQVDKRLALADQYFAAGEYFTAAKLYEQFLHPTVAQKESTGFPLNSRKNRQGVMGSQLNKTDILFKQAESYRLANYWSEASDRYKQCLDKDPVKYASGLYWYAVANRSLGSYQVAEENVSLFLQAYASGNPFQQAATRELETIQFIRSQITRPDSVLYSIQKINTSVANSTGSYAPTFAGGDEWLITGTTKDSAVVPGLNPFHNRLFTASMDENGFQQMTPIIINGFDLTLNQGTPSGSPDGQLLYFTQWKKEKGENTSAIYYSRKQQQGWSTPSLLPLVNIENFSSKQPFCTADGKYLYFASDRPGGFGQFDIWYAPLLADGTPGEPINAGSMLNSGLTEQSPFYHQGTGTLVFSSDRMPTMGGFDLFAAKGREKEWNQPENLGHPVNSSRDDLYFFTTRKESLLKQAIISSDRGSDCCLETFMVGKTEKKKLFMGQLLDCKDNTPVDGAEVVMKDKAGMTWKTITDINGRYIFDGDGDIRQRLISFNKDKYKEHTSDIAVAKSSESGWLIDTLFNGPLCLEKKLVIKAENVVSVYFDFDKSELKDRGVAQLDSIYRVLTADSSATIQISGYTDGRGTVEYNKVLSDKRAKACADYLVGKGIDSSRVTFESFGACCPVEMELINGRDNPDGRSRNRRALINIDKKEKL